MKLIKLLQFISYYQGEVVGHKRKRKEKGKNQEKNIRNQEQNKKKRESLETCKINRLRTLK